jgi:hypothetical protein
MFSNAVSCYDVKLLATRTTNKLKDTAYRMYATSYSVYYQLSSISDDHLLYRNLRAGHTAMTKKHLVQLMILSNYHDSFLEEERRSRPTNESPGWTFQVLEFR